RVLGIIEIEYRRPVEDAARDRRDVVAQRFADHHLAGLHPADAVVQRDPGARDRGRARAAVGLDHVAIDGDLALAERREIDHGAQAAADQALDLDGAAALLAGRGLAPGPLQGGARQHAVFRRDPAARLALEPGRQPVLERRRHQHVRVAELHEARPFGIFYDATLECDGAKLVGLSAARAHLAGLHLRLGYVGTAAGAAKSRRLLVEPFRSQWIPVRWRKMRPKRHALELAAPDGQFCRPGRRQPEKSPWFRTYRSRRGRSASLHSTSARARSFARSSTAISRPASRWARAISLASSRCRCRPPRCATSCRTWRSSASSTRRTPPQAARPPSAGCASSSMR